MKKRNIVLLSLISLSLVGCGETSNTVTNSVNQNSVVSTKNNTDSSTKKDTADKGNTGVKSDTTNPDTTSDTDSIYSKTKWTKDLVDMMLKYLDNTLLPYVDLKPTSSKFLKYSWSSETFTLTIMSNCTKLTDDMLNTAKNTYEENNWKAEIKTITTESQNDDDETITTESKNMVATNQEEDITVTFGLVDDILTLTAVYDEAFDASSADAWDETDMIPGMNTKLGNHAADIPYVYLGTVNPTWAIDEDGYFAIIGGKWNDKVYSLAKKAFKAENQKLSGTGHTWSYNTDYGFEASINLADGCSIKITIEKYSVNANIDLARMIISYKPVFVNQTSGSWTGDMALSIQDNFDGHEIPWFYCGSENITKDLNSTTKCTFYADVNTWNDKIFDNVENAIDDANNKISDASLQWSYNRTTDTVNYGGEVVICQRDCGDGCNLKFTVCNNGVDYGGDKAKITVTFSPRYSIPTGFAWSSDVTTMMNTYLGTSDIPYVYLGKKNTVKNGNDTTYTDGATATWNAKTTTLTIEGGSYYSSVINGANSAFTSDKGWTGSITTGTETNSGVTYSYYQAEKVLDSTTNTKLIVTVDGQYHGSNYDTNYTNGNCIMKIKLSAPYTAPTGDKANWNNYNDPDNSNEKINDLMEKYLDGHTIPFIYLNSSEVTSTFSKEDRTFYIYGGEWDNNILTDANSVFTSNGWADVTLNTSSVNATYTESDNCKLTVNVYKNTDGFAEISILIDFAFKTVTEWSTKAQDAFTNTLKHQLPLLQLGSNNPDVLEYDNFKTLRLQTYTWSDTLISDAQAALNNDGWTTMIDTEKGWTDPSTNTKYYYLDAYKEFDDGYIYLHINRNSYGCYLEATFSAKPASKTKNSWTSNELTYINSLTKNNADLVPYLYMGEGDTSGEYETSSYYSGLVGTDLDVCSIIEYADKLKNLGYEILSLYVSVDSADYLHAKHTDNDGNIIDIVVKTEFNYGSPTFDLSDENTWYVTILQLSYTAATTTTTSK